MSGYIEDLKDAVQRLHRPLSWPKDHEALQLLLLEAVGAAVAARDASGEKAGLTQAAEGSELLRLKSLNAELVALVLDDKEGDLDFVQFQVRSLLSRTMRGGETQ